MDFFARQEQARRNTKWLVLYFIVAVVLLIVAIYFISLVVFAGVQAKTHHGNYNYSDAPVQFVLWNPEIFIASTLGVLAVIFLGSAYKTNELSAGGSAVATLMGGRLVNQNMMQLTEELTSTENKISFARQAYNDSVMVYNTDREVFPSNLIANTFNFTAAELFVVDQPAQKDAPKVSFS